MSLRDIRAHVGELLISGFDGLALPPEMREIAREFDLGGLIIFSRNVEAPAQVAELALAGESLRKETPLWFSVDQEGGRVQRLKEPFTRWPPMITLGPGQGPRAGGALRQAMAAELLAVGVTSISHPSSTSSPTRRTRPSATARSPSASRTSRRWAGP
jgi:beta-N-acetylhexosaminidase